MNKKRLQKLTPKQQLNEFLLYTSPGGKIKVEVLFNDETIWATQRQMADLFGVEANTINYHLKEIYKSQELEEKSTTRRFRIVQKEGIRDVSREVEFYNLDAIISIGYHLM